MFHFAAILAGFLALISILSCSSSSTHSSKCLPEQSNSLISFKQELLSTKPIFSDLLTQEWYLEQCFGIRRSLTDAPVITNWNITSTDCCKWEGVTCNPLTGDVIGLDLACGALQGIIFTNSSLFNLPRLRTLNLAYNNFKGSQLSLELASFANSITHLNLSFCDIRGQPPFFPKLISLDLSGNRFQFASSTIQNLLQTPTLKELNLARTNLSLYKPKYLNVSSSLRFLNLKFSVLNGKWPYNILNLQHLEHLDLYGNNLNGPWPKINTSIPLNSLNLGLNFLSGEIPKSIGYLRFLTYLNLFQCGLVGSLPKTISKLHHLKHIDLAYNKLNGTIPFGLFSLPSLEVVNLHFNKFTGGLPPRVLSRSLKELKLYENELDGYVNQDSFTHVKGLVLLDLSSNNLRGTFNLYALLSSLPYLGTLNFSKSGLTVINDYTGRVNPHVPLANISLASCNMTMFPLSLRALKNLLFLDISNNMITHFPSFETGQLSYLYMGSNKIQGPIPSSLCNLLHLQALDISHNSLSGRLPSCLGDLLQIELLDLSRNQITGEIPPSFEKLKHLAELNLSQNHLEGCIKRESVLSKFGKDSFKGNLGLRGFPLLKPCELLGPPLAGDDSVDKKIGFGATMEMFAILTGIGLICFLVIAYILMRLMLAIGRPKWFSDFFNATRRRFLKKQD